MEHNTNLSSFTFYIYVVLQELFQQPQNVQLSVNADSAKNLPEVEDDSQLSKLPRPDVTQMFPFKPKMLVRKFNWILFAKSVEIQ